MIGRSAGYVRRQDTSLGYNLEGESSHSPFTIVYKLSIEVGKGYCTMAKKKCLCGKDATATAYLPMHNIFAKLKQVMEAHPVCDYHAKKAESKGFRVER